VSSFTGITAWPIIQPISLPAVRGFREARNSSIHLKLDFYNSRPWCELLSGTRSKLVQVFKGRHRADLLVKEILVFSSDLFTVTGQGISLRKRVGSAGARFFQRVLHSTCLVVGMLVLRGAHLLSASAAPTVELSHPMYVQVTVIVSFFFFFFFFSDLCSSSTVS